MVISLYYCPPTYCRQSTWVHVYQLFTRILNIVILCGGTCRTVVFNSLFSLQKKSQVASGDVPMETYYYGCQSLLGTRHHTLTFLQWPWPLTYDLDFRSTARYMPATHTQTKIKVRGQTVQKREWQQTDGYDRFHYLPRQLAILVFHHPLTLSL